MMPNRQPEETLSTWWSEIDAGEPPAATISTTARRQRRRRFGVVAAAGVVALLAAVPVAVQWAGLGEPNASPTVEANPERPEVNAKIIRGSTAYDYPGFDDIADAVASTSVGFAGKVVEWSEGRSLLDETDVSLNAVLKVRVTDSFNVPGQLEGEYVYVEVPRGGYVIDKFGEEVRNPGARPAYRTVDEISAAIPSSVRVIVLGNVALSDDALAAATPGSKVLEAGAGHPPGTSLVTPYPQGLLFETHTGGVASGMDHGGPLEWGWMPNARSSAVTFEDLLNQAKEQ